MKAGMIRLLVVGMLAASAGCAMAQPAAATNATAKANTPVATNTPAVTSTPAVTNTPAVTATTNAATAEKRVVVSTPATNTVTKGQEPAKK